VKAKGMVVDRQYYLKSLRTPLINMFLPIVSQGSVADPAKETERLLFEATKRRPWRTKQRIADSPIARAFFKRPAASQEDEARKRAKASQ
jgi:hypothetical protein